MPPIPADMAQAPLEVQIGYLARENELAWTQIKTQQVQLDKLADVLADLTVDIQLLKAKRGPGRPPKPPLEDKVMPDG